MVLYLLFLSFKSGPILVASPFWITLLIGGKGVVNCHNGNLNINIIQKENNDFHFLLHDAHEKENGITLLLVFTLVTYNFFLDYQQQIGISKAISDFIVILYCGEHASYMKRFSFFFTLCSLSALLSND